MDQLEKQEEEIALLKKTLLEHSLKRLNSLESNRKEESAPESEEKSQERSQSSEQRD